MAKKPKPRFNIDFFEFSFLVEACIPPAPIARTCFWHDVIDKYYHVLTIEERNKLYNWLLLSSKFKHGLESGEEDCLLFKARFDDTNQYIVTTEYEGKMEQHLCFKFKDKYMIDRRTSIGDEHIIKVERNALEIYQELQKIVGG